MVKKLLALIFCMIFLTSFISAWDFDNVKEYNVNSKTMTITNQFGFGETLARIQLMSEQEQKVNDLGPGIYQQVALLKFHEFVKDDSALEGISLYNVYNGMNKIDGRKIKLKYRTEKEVEFPIIEEINCKLELDGDKDCDTEIVGYETKTITTWTEFTDLSELPKKNIFVGIYVDVEPNEKVDWVPDKWFGEKIDEWAIWTTGTNALVHYYNFTENDGTFSDSVGSLNPDSYNGAVGAIDGIIGAGYHGNGTGTTDYVQFAANPGIVQGKNFTIQVWVNTTDNSNNFVLAEGTTATNNNHWKIEPTHDGVAKFHYEGVASSASGSSLNDGGWHHIVVHTIDAGNGDINATVWVDGVKGGSINISNTYNQASVLFMGSAAYPPGNDAWKGLWDEVGFWNVSLSEQEISDLYNGGISLEQGNSANPIITLSVPANGSSFFSNSVTFGCNATSDIGIRNITLYIDGTANETVDASLSKSYNWTTTKSMAEGTHTWNCKAADNATTIKYGWGTNNFTVSIDATAPQMNVSYPSGAIPYHILNTNISLNWTINDTNLDTCVYQYGGVNTTVICGANFTDVNTTSYSNRTIIMYANDTAGNSISKTINWEYYLFENSQTYNTTALEGATENLVLNVSYDTSTFSLITARLYYNGTFYSGTKTTVGDDILFSSSITTPNVVATSPAPFNWEVTLSNGTGNFIQNASNYSQSISPIALALCDGATYVIPFINFTIYDEATQIEMNGTFEATFEYGAVGSSKSNTYSYDFSGTNTSQYEFCVTPADESIEIDTTIKIGATNYVDTFYTLSGEVLTNTSTLKSLYLLNNTDSTSFIIKVREASFEDVIGAFVHVDRYDIGTGTWLNTEIVETNYEGKAIAHLFSEDADYRFRVWYSGENVYNSTSTKITCESTPCTVTLTIPEGISSGFEDGRLPGDFSGSLVFTKSTQIFTYTYEDSDSSFENTRLLVNRRTYGNATQPAPICNETKTATSGVITCDISAQVNGTYIAIAYLDRGTESIVFIEEAQKGMDPFTNIGLDGLLWGFFIFVGIVMLGVYRPSLGILFGIFGVVALFLIKLVSLTITAIVAVVIIGGILLWEMTRE